MSLSVCACMYLCVVLSVRVWEVCLCMCLCFSVCQFDCLLNIFRSPFCLFTNWDQIYCLTRSIQRTQTPQLCDLWPCVVTLILSQGQKGLYHWMSLIVLDLGTRYDVYAFITLRDITILFFMWHLTFTCDLQLLSRSLLHKLLDVSYVFVHWYQVWSY